MPTEIQAFEDLKRYQHSHELLGEKVRRRFLREDRGSKQESIWRQRARSLAYFVPALIASATWIYTYPIEKGISEAMGRGTGRAGEAEFLYDSCISLQKELESAVINEISVKFFLKNIFNWINFNVLSDTTVFFGGKSKTLKPLALNALEKAIDLIEKEYRANRITLECRKHILTLANAALVKKELNSLCLNKFNVTQAEEITKKKAHAHIRP